MYYTESQYILNTCSAFRKMLLLFEICNIHRDGFWFWKAHQKSLQSVSSLWKNGWNQLEPEKATLSHLITCNTVLFNLKKFAHIPVPVQYNGTAPGSLTALGSSIWCCAEFCMHSLCPHGLLWVLWFLPTFKNLLVIVKIVPGCKFICPHSALWYWVNIRVLYT